MRFSGNFAREQSRDYMAQENTALVKSIFQIVSDADPALIAKLIQVLPSTQL